MLTCVPSQSDRCDRATSSATLVFGLLLESSPCSEDGNAAPYSSDANMPFRLSPEQLRDLGEFCLEHADRAEEYLDRYRHADVDEELRGNQFTFWKCLSDGGAP
jgi:hypothetical protein